jgi:iron complex outermembrane recepter protein
MIARGEDDIAVEPGRTSMSSERRERLRGLGAGLLSLGVLAAQSALAQEAPRDRGALVEELVVTAQKREENLQDVPVSVAVVSAESLQAFGQNEAVDLAYRVPSLGVSNSAGPRSFGFFIRGIGTTSFASESIESSSAFVIDGVVLGQGGASLADLPDVERIEVLRGPQGTLFGKNASAGVINVVTKRPSAEFEAVGRLSWAWPDDERKASGYVTGPIGDQFRVLVSARINKRDGMVENFFDGRELNDRNDYGVRGRVLFTPSDRLTLDFIGDWWRRRADCCIWTIVQQGTPLSAIETAHQALGARFGPRNLTQNIDGDVFSDVDSWGFSGQADYEFGDGFTFTAISAFRSWHTVDGLDTDNQPINVFNVNFADFKQEQFTQELRITSPKGGFIDYVAGLFYFDSDVHSQSIQLQPLASPTVLLNRVVDNFTDTDNIALFGQANVNFTPRLRGIVGGRVLREHQDARTVRFDPVNRVLQSAEAAKTDEALVWRFGLQYDVASDINVFATVTRGYKGGGYDVGIAVSTLADIRPEKPTSYEIGLRSSFPDIGLVFNATAFHQEVEDLQVTARDPDTAGVFRLLNAANAKTRGVEAEVIWRPLGDVDLTFNGALAYIDGIYESFPLAPCYRGQTVALGCVGAVQDLSGHQLPFSPKWNFNVTAAYSRPISGGLNLYANINYSYRTKAPNNTPNDPSTFQEGYPLLNLALGVGPEDGRWKAAVFGKNVTDEVYFTRKFNTPSVAGVGAYAAYVPYEAQSVWGVALDVRY